MESKVNMPMKKLHITLLVVCIIMLSWCSKKKIEGLEREFAVKTEQVEQLEEQLDHMQNTNTSLLDRMSDLSVVNKAGAQSIQKSILLLLLQWQNLSWLLVELKIVSDFDFQASHKH